MLMPHILQLLLSKWSRTSKFRALHSTRIVMISCAALFLFASCARYEKSPALRLGAAKHFDIPFPLGFNLTPKHTLSDGTRDCMVSHGSLSIAKTTEFYRQELDKNGWDVDDYSTHAQGMIVASKPHKVCCVSIRSEWGKTAVHVFVKPKDL